MGHALHIEELTMQKLRSALLLPLLALSVLVSPGVQLKAQAAEGQVVIEDLTPSQLRREIKKIETEFYRVFNASVEDEKLAIICYDHLPTGSNIKKEKCEPQFAIDKRSKNVNDAQFGTDVLFTAKTMQRELSEEFAALTEAMTNLAGENEYFAELNSILEALRDELNNR
jgi:hypothetical protein